MHANLEQIRFQIILLDFFYLKKGLYEAFDVQKYAFTHNEIHFRFFSPLNESFKCNYYKLFVRSAPHCYRTPHLRRDKDPKSVKVLMLFDQITIDRQITIECSHHLLQYVQYFDEPAVKSGNFSYNKFILFWCPAFIRQQNFYLTRLKSIKPTLQCLIFLATGW